MPKIPSGARTTDLTAQAAAMRSGSFIQRTADAMRYVIRGITPLTWMSPNQPIDPQAPEAAGRLRDYLVGYNLLYTPRGNELTSFEQLRLLADNCDLVRLAIETRKDQLSMLQWNIVHIDPEKDVSTDPRVKKIQDILQYPDGRVAWRTWMRMLIEEVLVTDAVAIYPQKTYGGDVLGLEVMDGATLKVLTNADGRTPSPPSPAYQQVLKGIPAVDYTTAEIIYMPRNPRAYKFYGYSPVEQIQLTTNIAIRRAVSQLEYFTAGNIPEAFATLGLDWTSQQIKQYQEYWDTVLEGNQSFKRKVKFLPSGTKIEQTRNVVLQDTFDEWLARLVCYAFSLPPTAFVKQATRTTSDVLQEAALDEGLAPLKQWVRDLMNYILRFHFGYADLEFQWIAENPLDPQSQATMLTAYLKTGAMTVNEVRQKIGMDPIPDGDTALVYTASGATPFAEILAPKPVIPPPADDTQPGTMPGLPPFGKVAIANLSKIDKTQKQADLKSSFETALDATGESVSKDFAKGDAKVTATEAEDFADKADLSGLSLASDDYSAALSDSVKDGVAQAVESLGTVTPQVQAEMLSDAAKWATEHAAKLISSDGSGGELADATRNMIRKTLTQGINEGLARKALAQNLAEDYAFTPVRAELIAQTEIRNAQGGGLLVAYKRAGMMQKRWLLSNDENICPLCIANADQGWIPINTPFISGAEHPLQHPRCQCDMAARPEE